MFTDRFMKVPVEMYDRKQAEITGNDNQSLFPGHMKINAMEILSYRPDYNDDDGESKKTIVEFKNGNNISVLMEMVEFEKLLNLMF